MALRPDSAASNPSEYENNWCRETSLILIRCYKDHPCLYNTSHPDYLEKDKREEAIRQIVETLQDYKPNVTIPVVKKKIKTLLGQLYREKIRLNNANTKPGEDYKPKLWCYKDLEFLLNKNDKSKIFKSSTNIPRQLLGKSKQSTADDSNDSLQGDIDLINGRSGPSSSKKKRRRSLEEAAIAALKIAQNAARDANEQRQQHSPVEAFCQYLCAEIQQLRPETFNLLKIDMMELLNDAINKDQQQDACPIVKNEPPCTSTGPS